MIRQSAQEEESRKKSNELLLLTKQLQVRTDELLKTRRACKQTH